MAATTLLTTTLPMVVATGATVRVTEAVFKKGGKPVGKTHYHYKGKKAISHRHEGGHVSHYHRGLKGYGRTRNTLRR